MSQSMWFDTAIFSSLTIQSADEKAIIALRTVQKAENKTGLCYKLC